MSAISPMRHRKILSTAGVKKPYHAGHDCTVRNMHGSEKYGATDLKSSFPMHGTENCAEL